MAQKEYSMQLFFEIFSLTQIKYFLPAIIQTLTRKDHIEIHRSKFRSVGAAPSQLLSGCRYCQKQQQISTKISK